MSLQETPRLAPRGHQAHPVPATRRPRATRAIVTGPRAADGLQGAEQAAALAHDFNNLLTVILAASERLAETAAAGSQERDLATVCLDAAGRGADLLERIVGLSQRQPAAPSSVDCAQVVGTVMRFVRQMAPADIRLETSGVPASCAADAAALETAVLNLSLNAIDAMPEGGVLSLDSREVTLVPAAAGRLGLPAGPYARVTVSDTGHGMDAQTLAMSMQPFFTTKGSAGTGLGLASARDVAARSGGALSLASEPGAGTTACLYLPLTGQPRRG